ncbi:MAG: restriction endonuclease subunit S [Desulfuromonadales bacterium]
MSGVAIRAAKGKGGGAAGRPAYPEYKESEVEWLGEVPEQWAWKRLKFAVTLVNEKIESVDTGLTYFGLENIESWTGRKVETESKPDGIANLFKKGDVLFGKLRPYLAKVYHAKSEEGLCTAEALVLREKDFLPRYLFYYLLSRDFINIVDSSTYGSKMPRASWDFIGNLPALLPTPDEQAAIASFLDRETARIDVLIAKKQRLIELLQEKRTALISQAVTKGRDPGVPMKDSGVEWLGEVPAHWEVKRLKFLVSAVKTGGTPSEENLEGGDQLWFTPGDFSGELILEDSKRKIKLEAILEREVKQFPPKCVLVVGIGATLGKVGYCQVQCSANQQINVIVPKRNMSGQFLTYSLSSMTEIMRLISNSTTLGIMNQDKTKQLIVAVPPPAEQNLLVEHLNRGTQRIDSICVKINEAVDRLAEYRSALISAAVTGKIDVRSFEKRREVA